MAVVFDSVGFSTELDSLKSKVSDKLKSELKTAMTEESKSQLDGKNPNDAQAYTNFYNRVNPAGNFKKNIIPEDVYKAIMLESAVRDNTISKGFDIGNLDGKTVSAISSWFQGIFGKKTMTVGKYKITIQSNYSAQVTSPSGSVYSLAWTLDDTAKKALKAYIEDLKTYLSDYRYQIYGEIIKDGLSPLINEFIAEVAEGVDSAREKLINNFHEWALNKAADVAIDKILPKTYKQIKAVAKNYKTFVSKLNDLKTYAKTVKDDSIIKNDDRQRTALENFGVSAQNFFIDKQSGKDFARPQYRRLLRKIKSGDVLVVKSIDRLGRNYAEILEQWRIITKEKEAAIVVIDMPLLDTRRHNDLIGTLIADLILQIMSAFAQIERDFIKQRQAEGIAAAKARGVKFGRESLKRPENFAEVFSDWKSGKISARKAGQILGTTHNTFLKWLMLKKFSLFKIVNLSTTNLKRTQIC